MNRGLQGAQALYCAYSPSYVLPYGGSWAHRTGAERLSPPLETASNGQVTVKIAHPYGAGGHSTNYSKYTDRVWTVLVYEPVLELLGLDGDKV